MPGRERGTRYRYHAIEDGLWDDPKLEGTPFEERGFFAYLCANYRSRPAGIYRATDEQFAADTTLPAARVRAYLADLHQRGGIVRDGAWIFLPGYWARQAHNPGMIVAARSDVQNCTSEIICAAFLKKYPLHSEWLPNGCPTVAQRFANGGQKIGSPDQTRPDQTRPEKTSTSHPPRALPAEAPWGTPEALALKYNQEATDNCPAVTTLSTSRRKKALQALRQFPDETWWAATFAQYHRSRFLSGRSTPSNGHGNFQPDFDWLLSVGKDGVENSVKVHDGRYCDAG